MFRKAFLSILSVAALGTASAQPAAAQTLWTPAAPPAISAGIQIGGTPIQITLGTPQYPQYAAPTVYAPTYYPQQQPYYYGTSNYLTPTVYQPVYVHRNHHEVRRDHYHR